MFDPKQPAPAGFPHVLAIPRLFLPSGEKPHPVIRAMFGPKFGLVPRQPFWLRNQGLQYFCHKTPNDAIEFPKNHPLSPREAWDWWVVAEDRTCTWLANASQRRVGSFYDEQDTVKFGWPADADHVDPPSLDEKVEFQRKMLHREQLWQQLAARLIELAPRQKELKGADKEELEAITKLMVRVKDEGPNVLDEAKAVVSTVPADLILPNPPA